MSAHGIDRLLPRGVVCLDCSASTGEQIALAVRNATEGEMRRLEEAEIAEKRHGIFYQDRNRSAIEAGHRFVGRSATGASRYRLTQEQRERATRRFAALIKQMGYQTTP